MNTKESIIDILKKTGEPMRAGEIAEKTGIEKKEIEKEIKRMVNDNLLESPKRCFYDLKK
jgi:predicted ArsR family transcriptional regulator